MPASWLVRWPAGIVVLSQMLGVDRCARARAGRGRVLAVDDQARFSPCCVIWCAQRASLSRSPRRNPESERSRRCARSSQTSCYWTCGCRESAGSQRPERSRPAGRQASGPDLHDPPRRDTARTGRHLRRRGRLGARTRSTAARRHLDAISRPARADALLASQPQREPVPVTPVVSGSDRTAPRDLRVTRPQGVPKAPTLLTGAPSCPTTTPMSDWPTDLRSARRSSPIPKERA